MKPEEKLTDEKVSALLNEWRLEAPLPPRFQETVWRRISQAEAAAPQNPWLAVRQWIAQLALRPAFAFAYTSVLLAAGLLGGFWQSKTTADRNADALSQRYVQMVDPYQMPRH